jgi:hypothetical protein
MRPLTLSELRDNEEHRRLTIKIARRDAQRLAEEGGKQLKKGYLATMKEAGKLTGIIKRRIQRGKKKK